MVYKFLPRIGLHHTNSSREWQKGCAEQKTIETRGDKFVIGHEASKDAPRRSVSLAVRP